MIEQQITELLAQAEPLRLQDAEASEAPLTVLIAQINALRARQSAGEVDAPEADAPEANKPKRGRPAKVEAE